MTAQTTHPTTTNRSADSTDARDALRSLANRVRGEVRVGAHDRMLYSTDASIYQIEPLGVVIPADRDDAVAAVTACHELGLPVLPRGGGTSLAGQCVNEAVVIDVSPACRGVWDVDLASRSCRAEAGISIGQLNERLLGEIDGDGHACGLFFAPDPATANHATIGGCIGNNAAGSRSILYGRTSESVRGVEVCLADGRRVTLEAGAGGCDPAARDLAERVMDVCARHAGLIRERFPKTVRRNAGYALDMILAQMDEGHTAESLNLAPLICGAEGTLAFTLSAELALHPLPGAVGLAVVSFPSVDEAIEAVLPLLELGPSAVELLDSLIMKLARDNIEQRTYAELLPGGADADAVLYVEFRAPGDLADGEADASVRGKLEAVRGMFPGDRVGTYTEAAPMANAWALRKAGEPLLHGIPGKRKPIGFIEDAAVPPARLGEYVKRLRAIVEREGTIASYYAHASVGVLHVRPLLDLTEETDRAAMERIAVGSADLAKELGGVMSGEHGDGRARGPLLERYFGPELMGAFREVKGIFDPGNRLNPGNIVEPEEIPSIHGPTRLNAEAGHAEGVKTYFDFSDQGGLVHAAEMCNGAGVCRKTSGGAMCPSYRGTLDERHATRGRGNALRLAITGQLGDESGGAGGGGRASWDDEGTMETLDLCLSCKACKSECPSNVDVARMKAEYTAQRYKWTRKIPLKARVFGNIHTVNRIAGMAPGLSNLGMTLTRPIANAVLGLDSRRSLPRYERPLHKQWRDADRAALSGRGSSPVGGRAGGRDGGRAGEGTEAESGRSRSPLGQEGGESESSDDRPMVILYADSFTAYNEPGVGMAARRVLEAFGYRVTLYRGTDAGRALISVGMLAQAIRRIDREAAELDFLIRNMDDPALAVLFLEPSCLSAVTDDWVALNGESPEPDRRFVGDHSFLVEQFLADRWDSHPARPGDGGAEKVEQGEAGGGGDASLARGALSGIGDGNRRGFSIRQPEGEILLHAHCHQKALWGGSSSGDFLVRCFPGKVRVLDTTCCGLAGSFGYTRERFDLSMRIGELGVLPAARGAGDGDVFVAPGTSCRHQVKDGLKDGAGKRALHPVELVAGRLGG